MGRFVGALLTWGFGLCFLLGYLRLCTCFCASRGVLTLMAANWPLMLVNGFWLALLAMVVNALWVWRVMVVNGFATAWLWGWALMLRASHAVGRCVGAAACLGLCFLCGFLRFAHGLTPKSFLRIYTLTLKSYGLK